MHPYIDIPAFNPVVLGMSYVLVEYYLIIDTGMVNLGLMMSTNDSIMPIFCSLRGRYVKRKNSYINMNTNTDVIPC